MLESVDLFLVSAYLFCGTEPLSFPGTKMTTGKGGTPNKCLVITLVFSVLVMLLFAGGVGYYATVYYMGKNEAVELCETEGCIKAAEQFLDSMNTTVDPCQDFYQFSCGKFLKDTLTATGSASHFSTAEINFQIQVKELLEDDRVKDESFLKAQKYYSVCMNTTLRENITAFTEDLKSLGGWPLLEKDWNSSDWMTIMAKMLSFGYEEAILLQLSFEQDPINRTIVRIWISQPVLGLEEKENYVNASDDKMLQTYENFIVAMAKELSAEHCQLNNSTVTTDIEDALNIEVTLAEMCKPSSYFDDEASTYHPMSFGSLQSSAPQLDWKRFLRLYINESISDNETILVPALDVIQNITNYLHYLNSTYEGRRKLANYMIYRMVLSSSLYLNQEMNHINTDHTGTPLDMWKQCVTSTLSYFKIAVIAAYQKLYYSDAKRNEILALVDELKKQLAVILKSTSWLDEETIAAAIKKVNAIEPIVGFPNGFRNETLVNDWFRDFTVGENHFQNTFDANIVMQQQQVASFHRPANDSNWLYLLDGIETTNAFYEPNLNKIFITIGISSDFYYSDTLPMYINYGRLGAIIGHELTHSIDQGGSKFDELGNERNWWHNNTFEKYENESQCMIDLFSNFVDNSTGLHINGAYSVKETTADSVGARESYRAYSQYSDANKEFPLPAVPYSTNQLFWISYATLWCEKDTQSQLKSEILFDEHPPHSFRVNGLVSNNPDFAKDFHCDLGTPMNPSNDRCLIFGQ